MNAKLKQKSVHALLLAFVVASILFLLPYASVDHDSGFTSSDLEVKETVEENVTNASYVNSDGVITDAIDMGYATVQRLSLIHISEPTRLKTRSRMPSSA